MMLRITKPELGSLWNNFGYSLRNARADRNEEMEKEQIVRKVIDTAPKSVLNVTYGKLEVKLGNSLTPTQVKSPPTITWNADPKKLYLLCMTDPDAPSRKEPKFREWHHWLVGNIPGTEIAKGETLSEYIGFWSRRSCTKRRCSKLVGIENITTTTPEPTGIAEMEKEKIVPDVIGQKPPTITWNADPKKFYLLCLTDPDAPSRKEPTYREFHHWLVGNIPGTEIAKGDTLTEYVGSGPPQGTGLHRYVFLIYEQPGKLTFDEKRISNRSEEGRGKFSIRNLAKKYKLGQPIAGNFYQAEWDDYVPEVHKQLSGK
ncbi:Phosphatidylethanolamine-binding protein 1 [Orchesella cincta]|uniref:Phosphatidylethanolamine-binding protein 1 n=1 Tax=Orchesella cincta TaxID=48709 RepID=A0A1D2M5H7_ORCCI|nr:Phosphatidylethanolamine-binding protein 1 [Orchesella cincta]